MNLTLSDGSAEVESYSMRIIEKISSLVRRKPLTEEELAARAEAEKEREEARVAGTPGQSGQGGWNPGN